MTTAVDRAPGPSISVIIPTYNRRRRLEELLASIAAQTLPAAEFEVIVVDDGSTDDTASVAGQPYPFLFRYLRQENAGDAAARNTGAELSAADWLVFLDDDILVAADFLRALLPDRETARRRIVVGADLLWLEEANPLITGAALPIVPAGAPDPAPIPFADVCSNNMAIRRGDFLEVGPMEGLDFPGSSIWCDVEFAFRASRLGYEFVRRPRAFCWHRDYVARDLDSQKTRMQEAAYRAATLFRKHPGLAGFLPMFTDKTPIDLQSDGGRLLLRKSLRRLSSLGPVLAGLEALAAVSGPGNARQALQRWIIGAYIQRGYLRGLRDLPAAG